MLAIFGLFALALTASLVIDPEPDRQESTADGVSDLNEDPSSGEAAPISDLLEAQDTASSFEERNDGEPLIHKGASSRKLKYQTKMIQIIKASLKEHDTDEYNKFCDVIKQSTDVTTNKRFYMSEYGYSNVRDVLLGKTDTLQKAENFDRFELPEIIKWWKKLATKRHNNLMSDGRIRKDLEVWNHDTIDKIDIIR